MGGSYFDHYDLHEGPKIFEYFAQVVREEGVVDFDEVERVLAGVDHYHILAGNPGGRNKIASSAPKFYSAIWILAFHSQLAHPFFSY